MELEARGIKESYEAGRRIEPIFGSTSYWDAVSTVMDYSGTLLIGAIGLALVVGGMNNGSDVQFGVGIGAAVPTLQSLIPGYETVQETSNELGRSAARFLRDRTPEVLEGFGIKKLTASVVAGLAGGAAAVGLVNLIVSLS